MKSFFYNKNFSIFSLIFAQKIKNKPSFVKNEGFSHSRPN